MHAVVLLQTLTSCDKKLERGVGIGVRQQGPASSNNFVGGGGGGQE